MNEAPRGSKARRDGLRAFGLSLLADVRPPGAWEVQPFREPSLEIRSVTAQTIEHSWSGLETIGWDGLIDGAPFVVERGVAGDHRFVHGAHPDRNGGPSNGTRAVHHLSADASVLQCAPSDPADPSWWRVVLDSVLFTIALLAGYEALHAAAVATPAGAVAITAATGGGKSTLLAELIQRGLPLLADDIVVLEPRTAAAPLAHPGPPLMTVPASSLSGTDELGESIALVGDERWIAMPAHPEPLPLAAIVWLDRHAGARLDLQPVSPTLAPVLSSLLLYPRVPERERDRFELASEVSAHVPVMTLTADPAISPQTLADLLAAQRHLQIDHLAS